VTLWVAISGATQGALYLLCHRALGALLFLRHEISAAALSHQVPPCSPTRRVWACWEAMHLLVYAMPVLGGLIADRFIGMRKAVTFGGCYWLPGTWEWPLRVKLRVKPLTGHRPRYSGAVGVLSIAGIDRGRRGISQTQYLYGRGQTLSRRMIHAVTPASPSFTWASTSGRSAPRCSAAGWVRSTAGHGALVRPASA